jgi:hypothetical protein
VVLKGGFDLGQSFRNSEFGVSKHSAQHARSEAEYLLDSGVNARFGPCNGRRQPYDEAMLQGNRLSGKAGIGR